MTSRLRIIVVLVGVLGGALPPVEAQANPAWAALDRQDESRDWLVRLKNWSRAVMHHVPGKSDEAVIELSAWTADQVKQVVADYLALHAVIRKASTRGFPAEVEYRKTRLSSDELRAMNVFGPEPHTEPGGVAKRAAMLHADVALLAPLDWSTYTGAPDTIKVADGIVVGYESHSAHWIAGRQLLDTVAPDSGADRYVRLWYHATSAALIEAGNLAAAQPHLEHAITVAPDDANVLYEMGFYHHASTAPSIQAVIVTQQRASANSGRIRSFGMTVSQSDLEAHLKGAERFFRRSVAIDESFVEARLRHGHVLLSLGRDKDAAIQIRQAAAAATPDGPVLGYLAAMLLGRVEEQMGNVAAAQASYAKAAALVPRARSPLFARAALERRDGQRELAWETLLRATDPGGAAQIDADPWWAFYRWQHKPAKDLLKELRALTPSGDPL